MENTKRGIIVSILKKLSSFSSVPDAVDRLQDIVKLQPAKPTVLSFVNAHAFNLCIEEKEFAMAILNSDLVLRDGVGMEILCRSIGKPPGINLNGTDFIPIILQQSLGKKIALVGTKNPYLNNAFYQLQSLGHQVVLCEEGFSDVSHYQSLIKQLKPDLIILGMGMPKQEKIAISLKNSLDHSCLIVNGGAIIDFLGRKVKRAPIWVRQVRLEWMYRFILEPKRLFGRYIIGGVYFISKVISVLTVKPIKSDDIILTEKLS